MPAKRNESLCIATLDPRHTAGTREVTKRAIQAAKRADYEPSVIFNAVPWDECVTVSTFLTGEFHPTISWTEVLGVGGLRIGRRFPEVESLNYISNYSQWKRGLNQFDKYIGVGGTALQCLPLYYADKKYACWLGTTLKSERKIQKKEFPMAQRLRYEVEKPILSQIEKKAVCNAETILAQSEFTKENLVEEFGLQRRQVEVVPVPIDTNKYHPRDREYTNKEIITVGRINAERKNIELLLKSFRRVLEYQDDVTLRLVGAELSDELSNLCAELGIESNVSAEGYVDDLVPLLQRGSVYALPSIQEGLGISCLEAMACGLPVVSTMCGGPQDYIADNQNGYLSSRDSEEFASYLIKILDDPALREHLGKHARQTVVSKYSEDVVLPQITQHLNNL
jgi:glycosyltransferase involved in cell wall biosynthesis